MGHIESEIMKNINIKPQIYTSYVDNKLCKLQKLKKSSKKRSVLKFMYEINNHNYIQSLDINVEIIGNEVIISTYTKRH